MTSEQANKTETGSAAGALAVAWGVGGLSAVLLFAVVRLSAYMFEALAMPLTTLQWAALVGNVVLMAWSEGYRGFQTRFSPRVAARALYLYRHPRPRDLLLAPLFVTGYYAARRGLIIGTWGGTIAIVALVLLVHQLGQPWRGIVDAGVVVGLTWGVVSLWHVTWATFRRGHALISPAIPGFIPEAGVAERAAAG